MPLHTGGLTDRVRIQRRTRTRVSTGDHETWEDVATRWARVVPFMVVPIRFRSDMLQFGQELSRPFFKVYLRGRIDLTLSDHRLIWDGKVLELIRSEIMRGGPRQNFTSVFARHDPDQKVPPPVS